MGGIKNFIIKVGWFINYLSMKIFCDSKTLVKELLSKQGVTGFWKGLRRPTNLITFLILLSLFSIISDNNFLFFWFTILAFFVWIYQEWVGGKFINYHRNKYIRRIAKQK